MGGRGARPGKEEQRDPARAARRRGPAAAERECARVHRGAGRDHRRQRGSFAAAPAGHRRAGVCHRQPGVGRRAGKAARAGGRGSQGAGTSVGYGRGAVDAGAAPGPGGRAWGRSPHPTPSAPAPETAGRGRRDLTLIRMTPDLIYDQMIGMGTARKLVFSWGGNPGVGSLYRLRDAVERGWPRPLEIVEHSHSAMAHAYEAGAAGLPCAFFRGYRGTDLPRVNRDIRFVRCPFTGEELAAVPALRPDVTIVHAQKADRRGNVLFEGIIGVQKEAALAARRAIVTRSEE